MVHVTEVEEEESMMEDEEMLDEEMLDDDDEFDVDPEDIAPAASRRNTIEGTRSPAVHIKTSSFPRSSVLIIILLLPFSSTGTNHGSQSLAATSDPWLPATLQP